MRARAAMLVAVMLVAGSCQSPASTAPATPMGPGTTPSGPGTSSPGAATSPSAGLTGTAAPTADAAPITGGRWEPAGELALGRRTTQTLVLADGSVMVVGNDSDSCVRDDSVRTEMCDRAGGEWVTGPSLNKPRSAFAAVALADGRALITGGINADGTSYSSTYLYDPTGAGGGWRRSALLRNARTSPAYAVLPSGRVLVAGGYFGTMLSESPGSGEPGELDPIPEAPALDTAELYDPTTDTWSTTGHLGVARTGAAAVTLADGRVLVAGSRPVVSWGVYVDDAGAPTSAEVFDPGSGRFGLTAALPAVRWTEVLGLGGSAEPSPEDEGSIAGTLVALSDGGALLVGQFNRVYTPDWSGEAVRTLRFNAVAGSWRTIDQQVVACSSAAGQPDTCDASDRWPEVVSGHSRRGAMAVTLADGKVLIAGGIDPTTGQPATNADLYDPATDTWSALPALPEPRAEGAAAVLGDGSVIIAGGYARIPECAGLSDCGCTQENGLATVVRFVPGR
jgi:hypothetical protein